MSNWGRKLLWILGIRPGALEASHDQNGEHTNSTECQLFLSNCCIFFIFCQIIVNLNPKYGSLIMKKV